jgi:hypothetical protein
MGIKVKIGVITPVEMQFELPPWVVPEGATIRKSPCVGCATWMAKRQIGSVAFLGGSTRQRFTDFPGAIDCV